MKISKITITNLKAFDRREIELGDITAICGRNGMGKSTILNAINFLLGNGVEGEKVDGRNILALVPDQDQPLVVSAEIEHNGVTALVERRREPTATGGLSRSKLSISVPDGVDDTPWRMATDGKLASVAHVHEWLTIKKQTLRAMIASLAEQSTPVPARIKSRISSMSGSLSERLELLSRELKEQELELKREHKSLCQTLDSNMTRLPTGSAEELNALSERQRRASADKAEARTKVSALQNSIAMANAQIKAYGDLELPSHFDLAESERIVTPEWLAAHWERVNKLAQSVSDHKRALDTLKDQQRAGHTCHACGQDLPADKAAPKDIDFLIVAKQAELDEDQLDLDLTKVEAHNANAIQARHRAYIHAFKGAEDRARLKSELDELTAMLNEAQTELDAAEQRDLDAYLKVNDMKNALRAQATFYEGQQRKTSLETKIGEVSGLRAEVDNVLGSMARFGRQALEAKLRSYYSAQLGEPIVNVEEGRIGLERAGRFYEGLALSGAERDLLATAIDCAFKDLQGTPKVILLEADTIDPDNLKMTLDRLKERVEAGDLTQVVLATWYNVAQIDSSVSIVKL